MSITVTSNSTQQESKVAPVATQESVDTAKQSASSENLDETTKDSESLEADPNESEDHESLESKQDDEDEVESDKGEDKAPKKDENKGVRKRIAKFQKELSKKDQEIELWKAEALKAKAERESKEQKVDLKPEVLSDNKPAAPRMNYFDTYEAYETARDKYQEDLSDWKIEQKDKKKAQEAKEKEVKDTFEKQQRDFFSKVSEFKKTATDYDDVISEIEEVMLNPGIIETIVSSDNGPEIMYEIAKNREELDRINALSPLAAARELGKFLAKIELKSQSSGVVKKEEKKITKAAAPLAPVGGKGASNSKKSLSDPDISQAEFEAIVREQQRSAMA